MAFSSASVKKRSSDGELLRIINSEMMFLEDWDDHDRVTMEVLRGDHKEKIAVVLEPEIIRRRSLLEPKPEES